MKRILSILLTIAVLITAITVISYAQGKEPLQIGVISDIHYFPAALTGNYCEAFMDYCDKYTRQLPQSEALLEAALNALAKHKQQNGMKYLLIAGDNSRDGEYTAHHKLAERLERFERETGIQVIATNGNHDINNAGAATFENGSKEHARRTAPEDWPQLYKNLGFDLAYHTYIPPQGKKAGMLSYSVRLDGGYRLIVMDGEKYSGDSTSDGDDEHEGEGNYSKDLMQWILAEEADAARCGEEVIGLSHHSIVPHTAIEPTVMPTLILDNWLEQGEALANAGMHFVFTGHMHQNDIARDCTDSGETMADIATASLTGYPNTFKEVLFDNTNGGLTADIKTYDADCEEPIVFLGVPYQQPYKNTFSFGQSFGHGGLARYGIDTVSKTASEYLDKAKQQGFLPMLKGLGVDVEGMVGKSIGSGLTIGNLNVFTSKNIMGIINDLAAQIQETYVNHPERVRAIIEKAIGKAASLQVSQIPCTKFIGTLGFGNADRGGDFEEFGMSLLVYMFGGDEDLSDDPFMSDVLNNIKHGDFTDRLLNVLTSVILDDLLKDELLSTLQVRISPVFTYTVTRDTLGAFLDFALKAVLDGNTSYGSLINFLCKLGAVPQQNVRKLLDGAINIYADESGLGKTLGFWVESLITDSNPGLKMDSNVKISYTGPVLVTPTEENGRLPSGITVSAVGNSTTSKKITWYTKYSVSGTDIEIIPYSKNPVFSGMPSTGPNIKASTINVVRKFNALELTGLGFFPYNLNQVYHTAEVSGLAAGKKYLYRVGDASKGWWSEAGTFETYAKTSISAIVNAANEQYKIISGYLPAIVKVIKLFANI